jgi:hypothetical protein
MNVYGYKDGKWGFDWQEDAIEASMDARWVDSAFEATASAEALEAAGWRPDPEFSPDELDVLRRIEAGALPPD